MAKIKIEEVFKRARKRSDNGEKILNFIDHPKYGRFFLMTERQLKEAKIKLNDAVEVENE